jgi:carbamoyltransferase
MSTILGLSWGFHDGSVCIVKDGKLISAIATERLTKVKKDRLTEKTFDMTIQYVFDATGLSWKDIDTIATSGDPCGLIGNDVIPGTYTSPDGKVIPIYDIAHHLCHSASAYYTSQFDRAVCFSLDASSADPNAYHYNSSICVAEGNKIKVLENPPIPWGRLYNQATENVGLGPGLHKAGTMMGLASYGKPIPNCDYDHDERDLIKKDFVHAINVAATTQKGFEMRTLEEVQKLPDGSENLCLSGGSFLNCNANSHILRHSKFKNIHHFPAVGDDGIGVGAALYVAHHILNEPRYYHQSHEICYTGKDYPVSEINYEYIAKRIAEGAIVAWMNGRSEFGPRALGNRSLLADPRNQHNRDRLNHIIKTREWFRPFAPLTLEETYRDWFDLETPSPFMLYTAQVKQPKEIPAVTHVDGTARFQTVTLESNERIYKLIKEFEKITGVPVLINTSLNGKSQPILETPEDGLRFFETTPVDMIVIHGKIIER